MPTSIKEKVDKFYWESSIDDNEIGRGHPKFCIKGYDLLIDNNIELCIKLRASDITLNTDKIITALDTRKICLWQDPQVLYVIYGLRTHGTIQRAVSITYLIMRPCLLRKTTWTYLSFLKKIAYSCLHTKSTGSPWITTGILRLKSHTKF